MRLWSKGRIGKLLSVVLVLLLLLGLGWWQWPYISNLPFVPQVLSGIRSWLSPIPRVPEDKLTIAVAHLENDDQQKSEELLLAELEKFGGLTVSRIDQRVQLPSRATLQESIAQGHEQARTLLGQSGAQALLWGSVLEHDGRTALQLRWTVGRKESSAGRYVPDTDLNLPPVFWEDLTKIVGLIVQTRLSPFLSLRGTYQADKLKPFIADTKQLLSAQSAQWQPMDRASVEFALAYALLTFGVQAGDNSALSEAIKRYRSVLNVWTRERVPLDWAATQNNLGAALSRLGDRESDTQRLQQAVEVFRAALTEFTRQRVRVPLDWAMTQNNLGNALGRLGERESGTQHLRDAVAALDQALEVFRTARATRYIDGTERNLALARANLQAKQNSPPKQ